jgi:phage terminase large subunit GpA-like protein
MSSFAIALGDVCGGHQALRPPNRVSVSAGAAANLFIKRPGGAAGYWNPMETPYMVGPMDTLASRIYRGVVFVGPAQTGKCLDVATPIATPGGWTTMGTLQAGAWVYDDEGRPTEVLEAHPVLHGRPCFSVEFDDGSTVVADDDHLWRMWIGGHVALMTTLQVRALVHRAERSGARLWRRMLPVAVNHGPVVEGGEERVAQQRRAVVACRPVPSRPVRCIRVDNARSMFLAGRGMVPTHNTVALGEGWLAHAVANDPGDMLIVQMTQDKAREYSKQRIDRMMRHEKMAAFRGPSSKDATIHDRQFSHGMWLKIAWPTVTNLSSTSYRYVFITDYDRIPDDIDGEGDAWTLGGKRPTTFMSRGKIAAESSPGRPLRDPHWRPATPHEAPPVKGILGIYNTSDRRRWQWQCPHCREWLEPKPGVDLFGLPSTEELLADIRGIDIAKMARQYARIRCPHGGHDIAADHKDAMNRGGLWVPDGQHLDPAGRLQGTARQSDIAGFWLGGAAATYVSWETLIGKHLQALLAYSLTGDELPWQTTVNTDQGAPYMARALAEAKAAKNPADRKDASLQRYIVPAWARFLRATVDVQGGIGARFVVQVEAVGPERKRTIVDRYSITESLREGEGGMAPVDPAAYAEDWDVLTERVMRSTYRVAGGEQELRVHQLVVDTGGEGRKRGKGQAAKAHEGVTANAYAWWRRLKREGQHRNVVLIKGMGAKGKDLDWLVRKTEVGGRAGKGDVPLYLLNSNRLKDMVNNASKRDDGPGALLFPSWLSPAWFDEFTAEVRNEDGTWTQIRTRNESFDLCCYGQAGDLVLKIDTWRDWDNVPSWAAPLDEANSNLITREERREMQDNDRVATTPVPSRPTEAPRQRRVAASSGPPQRRVAKSSYLG